jgi:predicted acylesterase/phospholipase RssA
VSRTGLVLTAGGLRGICAQTGALMALEERGTTQSDFEAVIGCSAGAIVGTLFCSGLTAAEMAERISGLRKEDYLDPVSRLSLAWAGLRRFKGWTGYYKGEALARWIETAIATRSLSPDLFISVTNLSRRRPETVQTAPSELTRAWIWAMASAAIPIVYRTVPIAEEQLVDGGVANSVPARELAIAKPAIDDFFILTTLTTSFSDVLDNSFREKPWTPSYILTRCLDAALQGVRIDNLNTWGKTKRILKVKSIDMDFDEPERCAEAIQVGYEDAKRQLEEGAVRL